MIVFKSPDVCPFCGCDPLWDGEGLDYPFETTDFGERRFCSTGCISSFIAIRETAAARLLLAIKRLLRIWPKPSYAPIALRRAALKAAAQQFQEQDPDYQLAVEDAQKADINFYLDRVINRKVVER